PVAVRTGFRGRIGRRKSLSLNTGKLYHLGPFFGFISNKLREVSGRAGKYRSAQIGEPRLDLGVGESRIDLIVELVDDLGRGVSGGAPRPNRVLASQGGMNSATVGKGGKPGGGVAVATEGARTLPARMCWIEGVRLSNMPCPCPPIRSMSAGAAPR